MVINHIFCMTGSSFEQDVIKLFLIDESEHFLITGMYTCLVKNLYWRSLSKTKIYFLFSRACEPINWLSKGYSLNLLAFCRACLNYWMLAVVHLCPLPVIWLGCSGLFLCVTISVVFVTNCFLLYVFETTEHHCSCKYTIQYPNIMNHSNTLTGKNSYKIHMSIHWIRLQSSFIKKKKKLHDLWKSISVPTQFICI